jgi:hypothetical protein
MILYSREIEGGGDRWNCLPSCFQPGCSLYTTVSTVVLSGYLMGLQRPGQVVYWLQQVLGIEAITKEVLSTRTEA